MAIEDKSDMHSFLDNLPEDCTSRDVIKKICNLDIERNDAQKRYIENLDAQSAVLKLVTLGYREEAKQVAKHCFKNSNANFDLKFAREMADFLMNHEYKFGSLQEASKWEQHYLELDKIIRAQAKARRMYGTVLNNYMMGLSLPRKDIIKMVKNLEGNLKYKSKWYLYYYYQIKSLLYEGKDLEQMLLTAIIEFEKRFINQWNFIVVFKVELINYYKKSKEFEKALVILKDAISLTKRNTIPRINITFAEIELYIDMKKYDDALIVYNDSIKSQIFKSIPAEQKMKWQLLYDRIIEESKY